MRNQAYLSALALVALLCEGAYALDTPTFDGLRIEGGLPAALLTVPGPYPGISAWATKDGSPQVMTLTPTVQGGARGSIMLWFGLDRTLLPDGKTTANIPLLDCKGALSIQLRHKDEAVSLQCIVGTGRKDGAVLNVELPGLPGSAWYHLALTWDADRGILDGYLNGMPLRIPGTTIKPWKPQPIRSLDLAIGRLSMADVRWSNEVLDPMALRLAVGRLYWGTTAFLLGACDRGTNDLDTRKGSLLYDCPMASLDDVKQWIGEGPMKISCADGWMTMASDRPDGPEGHVVFWCPTVTADNYLAEWEVQPLDPVGLCIVFFSARGVGGEDIFDEHLAKRDGVFTQYTRGDTNSYHISYYANTPPDPGRITSNLRKNSGFRLVSNGPPGIMPGSQLVHHVRLMKDGPRIVLTVDHRVIIDCIDDGQSAGPVLGAGRIGLRQMQWMNARYRNFRIHQLTGE